MLLAVAAGCEVRAQAFYGNFGGCGVPRPGLSVTWAGNPSIQLIAGWGGGYRYAAPYVPYCAPVVRYVCYPAPVVNYYYGTGPVVGGFSNASTRTTARRVRFAARPSGGAAIVPNPVVFRAPEQAAPHYVQRPLR